MDELDELQDVADDEVSLEELRRLARRRRQRARSKPRELRIPGIDGNAHKRMPWWRWEEARRRWVRTDGQNWPDRPYGVLDAELARMDREIPRRADAPERWGGGTPIAPSRIRRVARLPATLPIRLVCSVYSFDRRVASYAREVAVRPGAKSAAAFYANQAAARRRQVAELRVRVPWAGRELGQGVAP